MRTKKYENYVLLKSYKELFRNTKINENIEIKYRNINRTKNLEILDFKLKKRHWSHFLCPLLIIR